MGGLFRNTKTPDPYETQPLTKRKFVMKTTLLALLAMTTSAMAMGKYKTDANIAGKLNETLLRGPDLRFR